MSDESADVVSTPEPWRRRLRRASSAALGRALSRPVLGPRNRYPNPAFINDMHTWVSQAVTLRELADLVTTYETKRGRRVRQRASAYVPALHDAAHILRAWADAEWVEIVELERPPRRLSGVPGAWVISPGTGLSAASALDSALNSASVSAPRPVGPARSRRILDAPERWWLDAGTERFVVVTSAGAARERDDWLAATRTEMTSDAPTRWANLAIALGIVAITSVALIAVFGDDAEISLMFVSLVTSTALMWQYRYTRDNTMAREVRWASRANLGLAVSYLYAVTTGQVWLSRTVDAAACLVLSALVIAEAIRGRSAQKRALRGPAADRDPDR